MQRFYLYVICDAYLPINLDIIDNYKFSLVFPIGLVKDTENKIIVTCGEGDYYSIALEFNINDVQNDCKYDAQNLNMNIYIYYFIAQKNNKLHIHSNLKYIESHLVKRYALKKIYNK